MMAAKPRKIAVLNTMNSFHRRGLRGSVVFRRGKNKFTLRRMVLLFPSRHQITGAVGREAERNQRQKGETWPAKIKKARQRQINRNAHGYYEPSLERITFLGRRLRMASDRHEFSLRETLEPTKKTFGD
jgi:hypothetical protein